MSKKSFVEKIEVKAPCGENWNEMRGGKTVRFCSHCSKSVSDLSRMTRRQALKIVRESNGNLCVRYVKNPASGAPLFSEDLTQISARRTPRLAVSAITAALSLTSMTYAQGGINPVRAVNEKTEVSEKKNSAENQIESATATLSGTILDPAGAVIPGISIFLSNEKTGETRAAASNDEGFYEFQDLDAGIYTLEAKGIAGFANHRIEQLTIAESENLKLDVEMSLTSETVMMGVVAVAVDYANPLFNAVNDGNLEATENLIARGENVNVRDEDNGDITPLFLAVENGNAEIAETLLSFGAKVNARDENKQTPLMRLDGDALPELIRVLIKHGAKINLTDKAGNSTLMLAAAVVRTKVLQILLDHRADVNARDKEGRTALMNAAEADQLENVRALLLAGADIRLKNEAGETVWDLTDNDEIKELLESHGANFSNDSEEESESPIGN
jgi:hypothetical protein